jgi:hypothetical protein
LTQGKVSGVFSWLIVNIRKQECESGRSRQESSLEPFTIVHLFIPDPFPKASARSWEKWLSDKKRPNPFRSQQAGLGDDKRLDSTVREEDTMSVKETNGRGGRRPRSHMGNVRLPVEGTPMKKSPIVYMISPAAAILARMRSHFRPTLRGEWQRGFFSA